MTGRRKAQLNICKIGKAHAYASIAYGEISIFARKIGITPIAKYMGYKSYTHLMTSVGLIEAALSLYPKKEES